MRNLLAAILLAGASLTAHAKHAGSWFCDFCPISAEPVGANAALALSEAVSFIKANINSEKKWSWNSGDTITICDGANCILIVYQHPNVYTVAGPRFTDPKSYVNTRKGFSELSTGVKTGYSAQVYGHIESIYVLDHTTGNIYFVESAFVIDGMGFVLRAPPPIWEIER